MPSLMTDSRVDSDDCLRAVVFKVNISITWRLIGNANSLALPKLETLRERVPVLQMTLLKLNVENLWLKLTENYFLVLGKC